MKPVLLAILCGVLPLSSTPGSADPGLLVIRNVTVIDATGAPPAPNRAVVVQDGRILAVVAASAYRVPAGARVVDGTGRYLIPGLWDTHVHLTTRPVSPVATGAAAYQANSRYYLPLLVSYGITGVRDMAGNLALLRAWRDSVESGLLVGPRLLVTGWKVGQKRAVPGAPFPLKTEDDIRRTVRLLKQDGADFVKVDGVPRRLYPALADECRRQGLTFVGHVSPDMTPAEASRFGQRSIEHLDGVLLSLSGREGSIRARLIRQGRWWMRWAVKLHLVDRAARNLALQEEILDSQDPVRAESLYAVLRRNHTWQVPTLSALRDIEFVREPRIFERERALYTVPPRRPPEPIFWQDNRSLAAREFDRQMEITGEMYRAGVPILAGTDLPGMRRLPGFSLAEELALLVRAGLPPMAALQAATRDPARFLGAADSMGTVEPGKVADLVLLDANPLEDISDVHRVHAVVLRGRYFGPAELDSLRGSVRSLVLAWRDSAAALSRNLASGNGDKISDDSVEVPMP